MISKVYIKISLVLIINNTEVLVKLFLPNTTLNYGLTLVDSVVFNIFILKHR